MQTLAHDTANDIAVIKTADRYYVRYALAVTDFANLISALEEFQLCQRHALAAELDEHWA